jgi:alpha-N-arabinofuranosidase
MPVLRNPGFESGAALNGWERNVYGATPSIETDTQVVREGRRSLRVSATAPSDTAIAQEALLEPGAWYRFRGWVRTRGLDPMGSPTYGTLQVQRSGGRGILAAGPNQGGDTDWTEVKIVFRAPPEGRVRFCAFFVGFGKGTGTAWFDGLKLEEVNIAMAPLKVTRETVCAGEISPFQYGQFIEYLCNLVPGMWAEKLYDGSFEGLSPYAFEHIKETDFKEKPWYPSGATNRAEFTRDSATKVSGETSQKIAAEEGAPCTIGVSQDGIAVERSKPLDFSVWLRGERIKGPVRVRLRREGRVLAASEFIPTAEWKKYRSELIPSAADANATLTIEFRGPGTLWLDDASLMPRDTVGGWRRDVAEAVRALKPGIIRFGGSAVDYPSYGGYDWRKTIGDPDHRTPFRSWGGLQPTGAGLEEIVQFIRAVGAEPLLCVRFNGSTPREAAAQVEYFNGASDTPMGALRAKNSHPEPYRIKYWQVGNEVQSAEYDAKVASFCEAMKQADPTIKLLSSFPTPAVIKSAGSLLDYACPHHYGCDNLPAMQGDIAALRQMIRENAPGRDIRIAVTEWNTTAGDVGPRRAMLWTLANALACSRYHNLMHRNCDIVEIANRSNLTNSFCSGIIQTDNHRLYKTPTYYAQQLYATLAGRRPLRIESETPPDAAPDISATLSADGKELTLFAVNDNPDEITRVLDLTTFGAKGQKAAVWTLADRKRAGEPDVANSFGDPERIVPVRFPFDAPSARFDYRFPPYSLTVLRWRCEQD